MKTVHSKFGGNMWCFWVLQVIFNPWRTINTILFITIILTNMSKHHKERPKLNNMVWSSWFELSFSGSMKGNLSVTAYSDVLDSIVLPAGCNNFRKTCVVYKYVRTCREPWPYHNATALRWTSRARWLWVRPYRPASVVDLANALEVEWEQIPAAKILRKAFTEEWKLLLQ